MSNKAATVDATAGDLTVRHATLENAPSVPGRRSFFQYRDLGVTEASGGKLRAQVMQSIEGMNEPTGWHYHECDGQFVYMLKGWVDLEFETGEKIRVNAGESLFIPGGLKHNETALSDDSGRGPPVFPGASPPGDVQFLWLDRLVRTPPATARWPQASVRRRHKPSEIWPLYLRPMGQRYRILLT